ncbi:adenylate cyclase 1-like protein [Naegleria gruberi]|uniref:Adenylate cyclase 1-like protein n=1 Tax=Naegleria gruberi TaxID=5762 RepID=D2VCU6_NAEGR|nr:adenylate cyclase 1-like protein [Naegleria gruberi]EFC45367.1 adenylate cyclase 1-like protein [Naegleria gruberi]|eukprot:XP_002678111.1 adenylate cyclase 1-like protein [Naegleria gruberi strain NEG-M]
MEFKLENIVWNVFLVVYADDISRTVNINTAISVGVAVFVIIVGLLTSVLIGYMITEPLKYLEKQFMKIKKFDLTSVHFTSSRFKEIDVMYEDLHEMVVWLNEFKSFLPESIFNQLRNMENSSESGEETPKQKNMESQASESIKKQISTRESKDGIETSSRLSSSHDGSFRNNEDRTSLFKLGLSEKEASIVLVKISEMCKSLSTIEIAQLFSKIASGLSALAKTMQADLQILSIDQYQISFVTGKKKSNIQALEAALKISKSLSSFLSDYEKLSICIGITTGKANVGNLGTNSLRFYSIVGSLLSNAEKLCTLSRHYNIQILADSKSLEYGAKTLFVTRPMERIEIENEIFLPNISTVYQVIKENSFSKDEWMYELEQQKENVKYKNFENAFSVFEQLDSNSNSASLVEKVNQSKSLLYEHLEKCPGDSQITNNVLNSLDMLFTKAYNGNIDLRNGLLNYRTRMDQSMSKVTQDSSFNIVEICNSQHVNSC